VVASKSLVGALDVKVAIVRLRGKRENKKAATVRGYE